MAEPYAITVQTGWRINQEIKRRIDQEAAKRGLKPARVVEQALEAMLAHLDGDGDAGR